MDADNWATIIVAVIGLLGLVAVNVQASISSNRREAATLKTQREHDSQMVLLNQGYAERTRLMEQKHAAYSELLRQLRLAAEEKHRQSEQLDGPTRRVFYGSQMWIAASQAKMVSSAEGSAQIRDIMNEFFLSHSEKVVEAETKLQPVFAQELFGTKV